MLFMMIKLSSCPETQAVTGSDFPITASLRRYGNIDRCSAGNVTQFLRGGLYQDLSSS